VPCRATFSPRYTTPPTFTHRHRAEGFGLTIAEALACGVPAVGLDYSAVPEVIGDGGMKVSVGKHIDNEYGHHWALPDEDEFARNIGRLPARSSRTSPRVGHSGPQPRCSALHLGCRRRCHGGPAGAAERVGRRMSWTVLPVSAQQVRDYLNLEGTTGRYDDLIGSNIRAAASFIERETMRQFENRSRDFPFTTEGRASMSIPDLRTA
jgi:hypothetical protein